MDGTGAFAISGQGAVSLPSVVIDGTGDAVQDATATGVLALAGIAIDGVAVNGAAVQPQPPSRYPYPYRMPPPPSKPRMVATGNLQLASLRARGTGAYSDDELVIEMLLGLSDDALIGIA